MARLEEQSGRHTVEGCPKLAELRRGADGSWQSGTHVTRETGRRGNGTWGGEGKREVGERSEREVFSCLHSVYEFVTDGQNFDATVLLR